MKIFLFAMMILLPIMASAESVEIDGIYYNLIKKGNIAEVTHCPYGTYGSNSVNIPSSVVYDGIEYNVTSIGKSAFGSCTEIPSISIPNSVTSIGEFAFQNCRSLYSIIIPNSVKSIGDYAFSDCRVLTSVTMPDSLTSIGSHLFYRCLGLTSVNIPNSVITIGSYAFYYCNVLTTITIPNSVTTIGNSAFANCSALTSIIIPNSVTSIGDNAFSGCRGLTSVTIPNSVTSIGGYAFSGCAASVTSVIVESGNTKYDSRNNCNAIIETETNTLLFGCKNTIIPISVTTIGGSAFSNCGGLASLTIPNNVTSIGWSAFIDCSDLKSVTIGNGVKNIEGLAFANCMELADVYCLTENVPDTEADVFQNSYIEYANLYVPAPSIDAYKTVEPWKNFKDIIEYCDPSRIHGITIGQDEKGSVYDINGRRLNEPAKGINIVGGKKVIIK